MCSGTVHRQHKTCSNVCARCLTIGSYVLAVVFCVAQMLVGTLDKMVDVCGTDQALSSYQLGYTVRHSVMLHSLCTDKRPDGPAAGVELSIKHLLAVASYNVDSRVDLQTLLVSNIIAILNISRTEATHHVVPQSFALAKHAMCIPSHRVLAVFVAPCMIVSIGLN